MTSTTVATAASKTVYPLAKETISPKTCMGLLHRGPYNEIGGTFGKLFEMLGSESGACAHGTMKGKVLGLYLDNPQTTQPEDLRSYAALDITTTADDNDNKKEWPKEWEKIQVGGGPAAVMTVNGSYSQLGDAWQSFGGRIVEQGWKFSTNLEHISQEMYIEMDQADESKNVTKLVMFLKE